MKKAGIVANTSKKEAASFACELSRWILDNGCTPFIDSGICVPPELAMYSTNQDIMFGECDFVIALGGDGTMLHTARSAAMYDVPILGVNMGRLGYLTDVEKPEAITALKKVLSGDYKEEKRMMLSVNVDEIPGNGGTALNEVVVSKGSSSRMITAELLINGEYIDTYRADGIMVSTPTGSTAYNLSAGGPILEPTVEMMVITLVCPHLIYARPYVISADDVITMTVTGEQANSAVVVVDGQNFACLSDGSKVTVSKSEYCTRTIRTTSLGFYDILRRKMITLHD